MTLAGTSGESGRAAPARCKTCMSKGDLNVYIANTALGLGWIGLCAVVRARRSRPQRGLVAGLHDGVADRQRQRRRLAHALSGLPGRARVPPVRLRGGHLPLLCLLLADRAVLQAVGVRLLAQIR